MNHLKYAHLALGIDDMKYPHCRRRPRGNQEEIRNRNKSKNKNKYNKIK